jgi:hypothetical protein
MSLKLERLPEEGLLWLKDLRRRFSASRCPSCGIGWFAAVRLIFRTLPLDYSILNLLGILLAQARRTLGNRSCCAGYNRALPRRRLSVTDRAMPYQAARGYFVIIFFQDLHYNCSFPLDLRPTDQSVK